MLKRSSALVVTCIALLSGCSAGSAASNSPTEVSAGDFTVSYRNAIRVPAQGTVLEAQAFATQIKTLDPAQGIRCAANDAAAFGELTSYLGGITWTHPAQVIRDASLPNLYYGRQTYQYPSAEASASSGGASAAPNIERPDLLGVQGGIAIFLSKQHGLLSVDTRGSEPNARGGGARSALLRFAVDNGAFRFVDSVRFDDQRVVDARLFDSTIVAYTSWTKRQAPSMPSAQTSGGPWPRAPTRARPWCSPRTAR